MECPKRNLTREAFIVILSGELIRQRLENGEIFKKGTWDESSIREASYVLRLASDGLLIDGNFYDPGKPYAGTYIGIAPGEIAILSTIERLDMPINLVGKIGVRFDPSIRGLTGLMGIQVDPLYGHGLDDERLFIRVINQGNHTVRFLPRDIVFTFELHEVKGDVRPPSPRKASTWDRIKEQLATQDNSSWSYVTRVEKRLTVELDSVQGYLQPLVMFGIFLVAITILGVALTVIVAGSDVPETYVPTWVRDWGWKVLLGSLSFGAAITGLVGLVTVVAVLVRLIRRQ